MNNFDIIKDEEGKEYSIFDSSELYDDTKMGDKSEDFELLRKLGKGSFGTVYKVKSKINNKIYAMKILNISDLKKKGEKCYKSAINEASFLEGLSHPHIIKYYKNFTEGDNLYIMTEFETNESFDSFIKAHMKYNTHIKEEELWNIFLQCMEALTYVHSKKVIHRDIKPANILMDNNMNIKLGDFGISAIKYEEDSHNLKDENNKFKNEENMQYHGTFAGTDKYMAKEVREHGDYNHKADVYSMGVTFYETCYFHIPIIQKVRKDINGKKIYNFEIIENEKDKKVSYSKELLNIIHLMLEEEKDKRKSSEEILNMFRNEYFNKYVKNTSFDSLIRCLFSFFPLNKELLKLRDQIENKPITKAYIECINNISNEILVDPFINSVNNFRKILSSKYPIFEGIKEIDPRLIFVFILKGIDKENKNNYNKDNNNNNYKDNNKNHLIISGTEESKINKREMMLNFVNNILININSLISNKFRGLMKKTNFCSKCKLRTFSFNCYFFISFNLEKIFTNNNNNNISPINLEKCFLSKNRKISFNTIYCRKCNNKTKHYCFKELFSSPIYLIISIKRGITYKYNAPINISQILDLTEYIEFDYSKKKFKLVGILGRAYNNGNESFFSYACYCEKWYLSENQKVIQVQSPIIANSKGDIIMLFYKSNENDII